MRTETFVHCYIPTLYWIIAVLDTFSLQYLESNKAVKQQGFGYKVSDIILKNRFII